MKLKLVKSVLINEFIPCIDALNQLQESGSAIINTKVGYAIGRNYSKAFTLFKEFQKFQKSEIVKYVELDEAGNPKFHVNEQTKKQELIFKSPEQRIEWKSKADAWLEEEIEFDPNQISEAELFQCNNIPVHTMTIFEAIGMMTTIEVHSANVLSIAKK